MKPKLPIQLTEPARTEFHDNHDKLQVAADDPSKTHVIMATDRLGSKLFCVKLEYEHYPPRSGRNKFFDFHIVKWPFDEDDKGILMWFIVGIPKDDLDVARQVAEEVGMELVNSVPVMILPRNGVGVEEIFPMNSANCWTLKSKATSLIYNNDHEEIQRQMRAESAECDRIIEADEVAMREELRRKGFSPDQIERIVRHWMNDDPNYMEIPEGGVPEGQNRMKE